MIPRETDQFTDSHRMRLQHWTMGLNEWVTYFPISTILYNVEIQQNTTTPVHLLPNFAGNFVIIVFSIVILTWIHSVVSDDVNCSS